LLGLLADLLAGWLGSRVVCKLVGYGSAASAVGDYTPGYSVGWLVGFGWLVGYGSAMVRLVRLAGWLALVGYGSAGRSVVYY
jgi:hypothetical protein